MVGGDAVAAFWGAGFAGRDYVGRTVRVARTLSALMAQKGIPAGIGVHYGVTYFGAMGSADGLTDFSAIGDEVNTAARVVSKAAAGEVLVSEQALRKAGVEAAGLEARSLELRGISVPVAVRVIRGG